MDKMKTCSVCGEEIAKSAKTCPKCGAKQKRKHPILGIFLVLFGVGLIGAALGGDNDAQKIGEIDTPPQQEQQTEFYVGDIVSLNDIDIAFISCSESKGSQFLAPDGGNVYVLCEFDITNNSDQDITVSSLMSFEAYVDDYSTSISVSAMASTDKKQLDGTVAAGKKITGVIGYEVPEDWKTLEIRFTPDFWSGKDIKFIAYK